MGAAASSDRAIVLNPCMPPLARSPAFCCPPPVLPPGNFCFPRAPIFPPAPPIPPQMPLCCSPTQPILPTRPAPILPSTPLNGCCVGPNSFVPNLQQQLCGLAAGLAMVGPHANPVGCGLPTQPPPIQFQGSGPCLPFQNGQADYPINQQGLQVNSLGPAPFSSDSFGPVQGQGLGPCQQSFDGSQPILPYPQGSNQNPPLFGNHYIGQNNFVNSSVFPQASSTPIACGTPYSGFSNGSFGAPAAQTLPPLNPGSSLPPLNSSPAYGQPAFASQPTNFCSNSFGGPGLPQSQTFATQSIPNVGSSFGLGASQSFGPSFNAQGLGLSNAGMPPPPPHISSGLSSGNLCGPSIGQQGFSTSQSFGSPALGSQNFGSPALGGQNFGSPALGGQSFGSAALGSQSFGPAGLGSQSFGSAALGSQSFGSAALGNQSFGAPTLGGQNFGSSPLASTSFGANGGLGVQSPFATGSFDSNGLAPSQPFYGGQYPGASNSFAAANLASINQPLQNLSANFNNLNLNGSLPNNFAGQTLLNHQQPVQNSMSYQLPTTVTQAPQQQVQYPTGSYQQNAAQLASAQQYAAHNAAQQAAMQATTFNATAAVAGISQPGANQSGISAHPDFQIQVNKVQRVREYCIPLNAHVRRPGPQQQQQIIVSPSQYSRHYAKHQIINCTQMASQRKGYVQQTIMKNSTLNSLNPCKQYTEDQLSKKQSMSNSEDDCQPCPPCPPCPTSSQSIKC